MGGVQLDADCLAERGMSGAAVVSACRERGVLTRVLAGEVLQITPPFVIEPEELDHVVEVVDDVLAGEGSFGLIDKDPKGIEGETNRSAYDDFAD
jgi:adenosylmethionine-8-amino-7-oxononanoate aminotransferase